MFLLCFADDLVLRIVDYIAFGLLQIFCEYLDIISLLLVWCANSLLNSVLSRIALWPSSYH